MLPLGNVYDRSAKCYCTEAEGLSVLALDLGGSHVDCAVVEGGRVLTATSIKTKASSITELLPEFTARLREVCRAAGIEPQACRGLGIGVPSLIDGRTGEIVAAFNKFTDLKTAALGEWSDRTFGLPVRFENDAALALLGEHHAGAARGVEDAVLVTLGTGIGVAAMLQNRLLRSHMGHAGSLGGHLIVRFDGRHCACGAIGCAEAEASTSALPEIAASFPGFEQSALAAEPSLDFAAVFRAKDSGDAVAAAILDHCLAVWSALAVTLVHAYGPQLMLFGGGVMRRGAEILGPVRAFVERHAWKSSRGSTRVEAAAIGTQAALIGAEVLFEEGYV